jgi:hypothetical protein
MLAGFADIISFASARPSISFRNAGFQPAVFAGRMPAVQQEAGRMPAVQKTAGRMLAVQQEAGRMPAVQKSGTE